MNPFSPKPITEERAMQSFVQTHPTLYKRFKLSTAGLKLYALDVPLRVVNHFQKSGVIGAEEATLPAGTLVWGRPGEMPVLKASCMNPLLPSRLPHPSPTPSAVVPEPSEWLMMLVLGAVLLWRLKR